MNIDKQWSDKELKKSNDHKDAYWTEASKRTKGGLQQRENIKNY